MVLLEGEIAGVLVGQRRRGVVLEELPVLLNVLVEEVGASISEGEALVPRHGHRLEE